MGADGATTETEETGVQNVTEEVEEIVEAVCEEGVDCPEETAIEDPDMGADGATLVKV